MPAAALAEQAEEDSSVAEGTVVVGTVVVGTAVAVAAAVAAAAEDKLLSASAKGKQKKGYG